MGYCTLELIVDHGHREGHGRCGGRKAEIGDTGLRIRSVLDQDVALRRDDIGLTKSISTERRTQTTHPFQVSMNNSTLVKV